MRTCFQSVLISIVFCVVYLHPLMSPSSSVCSLGPSEEAIIIIVIFVTIVTNCHSYIISQYLAFHLYATSCSTSDNLSTNHLTMWLGLQTCLYLSERRHECFSQINLPESASERLFWYHSCFPSLHQSRS